MRIVISGASGFIGKHLVNYLRDQNHEVYVLVRKEATKVDEIFWDPYRGLIDKYYLNSVKPDVIIHLSGENVIGIWTAGKKEAIEKSRVISTKFLAESVSQLEHLPKIFISASGMSAYYDEDSQIGSYHNPPYYNEESPYGTKGFLTEVTKKWETASLNALSPSIRLVHMRIGAILSADGGMLGALLLPFKFGLGGVLGDGQQYISWMSIDDLLRAVSFIIQNENIRGPVNFTSPNPVTNYEFTKALGRVLYRPTICWVPKFILNQSYWILGSFVNETILVSLRVYPKKLLDNGFKFEDVDLEKTLQRLCNQ